MRRTGLVLPREARHTATFAKLFGPEQVELQQVADASGINNSQLSRSLRRPHEFRLSAEQTVELAKALDVPLSDLLTYLGIDVGGLKQ